MSKNWDYSQLTHAAAEEGGPQKFIDKVADINFQRGVEAEKGTEGWKGALLVGGAIALWEGGKAIYRRHKARKEAKRQALLNASNAAKEEYIKAVENTSQVTNKGTDE